MCRKIYKLPENKIFVRTEQIIWTVGTNMYVCQTNYTNYQNKTFERIGKNYMNYWNKYVYVSNKFYKLTEQNIYTCPIN
jgi:hypothetical protein